MSIIYLLIDEDALDKIVPRLVIKVVGEELWDLWGADADLTIQEVVAQLYVWVLCQYVL